jgi:NAD(P)-dependent dehydrogenase (short-subunit alcohol dehydrogenase family)
MASGARVAIVTGAASGLGRAMALGLADSGIDVVAVDRNAAALGTLASAMAGRRGSVLTHAADLTRPEAFDGIAGAARERFGRIDILMPASARRRCGPISEGIPSASGRRRRSSGAASSP